MNNKGENIIVNMVLTAVAIIIGITLLIGQGGIASTASQLSTLNYLTNVTVTLPASGNTINLVGQNIRTIVVENTTETIPANNYTIQNNILLSDGTLGARLKMNAGQYAGKAGNLTYTYEPLGYASDSATRSLVPVIIMLCALAILTVTLVPVLRNGLIDMVGIK